MLTAVCTHSDAAEARLALSLRLTAEGAAARLSVDAVRRRRRAEGGPVLSESLNWHCWHGRLPCRGGHVNSHFLSDMNDFGPVQLPWFAKPDSDSRQSVHRSRLITGDDWTIHTAVCSGKCPCLPVTRRWPAAKAAARDRRRPAPRSATRLPSANE